MKLTAKQIYNYQNDGVILIQNAFVPWIEKLKIGFDKVLKNPGVHARENVENQNNGRFFEDYCNWERIDEFKDFILNSPAGEFKIKSLNSSILSQLQ